MNELIVMMAKILPEDTVVEMVEEALTAYKLAPSEDTKGKLASMCMLFAVKVGTEKKDIVDVMQELKHAEKISDAFRERAF